MTSSWGTTETSPLATAAHFIIDRAGAIGVPVPGCELKLVPAGEKLELYDLKKDLGQKHDLAKTMPQVTAQLHQLLVQWRKEVGAKMPTPNPEWKASGL